LQLKIEECCKCGNNRPIVNRKYMVCNECNYERRNGRKREDVYFERAKLKLENKPQKKIINKAIVKNKENINQLKKKFSIKKISSKKKYRCSDGSIVSEITIKRKYAEVCDKIDTTREPVCQGSNRGDVPLSHSHTISRARCKEIGKTELIWDPNNIELEGFEEPTSNPTKSHNIWEVGSWDKKSNLLNFNRKLKIIKREDPEQYRKIPDKYKIL
jgi:hypothetical protein